MYKQCLNDQTARKCYMQILLHNFELFFFFNSKIVIFFFKFQSVDFRTIANCTQCAYNGFQKHKLDLLSFEIF